MSLRKARKFHDSSSAEYRERRMAGAKLVDDRRGPHIFSHLHVYSRTRLALVLILRPGPDVVHMQNHLYRTVSESDSPLSTNFLRLIDRFSNQSQTNRNHGDEEDEDENGHEGRHEAPQGRKS